MKEIILLRGEACLVDDEDFEVLSKHVWHATASGYAKRNVAKKSILMHRAIMQPPDGIDIDHRNGNPLDNRRSNLRICTHAENSRNRKLNRDNTSGFKGVYKRKSNGRWWAEIQFHGKKIYLGSFDTCEKAAAAYDAASINYFGEFARKGDA